MSRPLDLALSVASSALESGRLPANALAEGARLALVTRARTLAEALAPTTTERVKALLLTIDDMPSRTEDDRAKLKFAIERDASDLSEFPEWALVEAFRSARKGEIGDGLWRPTIGQLASFCRQRVSALRSERAKIAAVLAAKVDPPREIDAERRREMADRVRKLAAQMTLNVAERDREAAE